MAQVTTTQITLVLNSEERNALVCLLGSMSTSDVMHFVNSEKIEQALQDIFIAVDSS